MWKIPQVSIENISGFLCTGIKHFSATSNTFSFVNLFLNLKVNILGQCQFLSEQKTKTIMDDALQKVYALMPEVNSPYGLFFYACLIYAVGTCLSWLCSDGLDRVVNFDDRLRTTYFFIGDVCLSG